MPSNDTPDDRLSGEVASSDSAIFGVASQGIAASATAEALAADEVSPLTPMPVGSDAEDASASADSRYRSHRLSAVHARRSSPLHATHDGQNDDDHITKGDVMFVVVLFCVLLVARLFLFGMYMVPSGSMLDTIQLHDHILTNKLTPHVMKLKHGDIVVFKDPANWLGADMQTPKTDTLVKRLIGLPGDTVECKGKGSPIRINGVAIDERAYLKVDDATHQTVAPSDFAFKVTVTPGNIFVLGDNRSNSADSRYHVNDGNGGLVPIKNVEGTGILTTWPLKRIGLMEPHHEVFASVPSRS